MKTITNLLFIALMLAFNACCDDNSNCVANTNDTACECPEIWQPVCGCDGETYSNSCFAECVDITDYTMGACNQVCEASPIDDCFCTTEYNPVCGCDDVTYSNSCVAECNSITDYTAGECP